MKSPYIRKLATREGLDIWLVNGKWVRDNIDVDFTEGGHALRYDYIPYGEIWIDNANIDEADYIIEHEIYERGRMAADVKYSQAHDEANVVERRARKLDYDAPLAQQIHREMMKELYGR